MNDDFIRAVVIPLASAAITGLFTAIAALAICGLTGQPLYYALAAGAISGLGSWLVYRGHWWEVVETVLLPVRAAPAQPEKLTRVLVMDQDGHQGDYLDLPCTQAQLITLASGLMSGVGMSLESWTGSQRPFSRGQFEKLRSELLSRGALEWRNPDAPAQGVELSRPGQALMRHYASMDGLQTALSIVPRDKE